MILTDFILLGTTVPESMKRSSRITVCSAGFSPELRSLVRIYPLARRDIPRRWNQYRIELERSSQDGREESWKIAGDRGVDVHERINERFQLVGKLKTSERAKLLAPYVVDSIEQANEWALGFGKRKRSLAILHPDNLELRFRPTEENPEEDWQETLWHEPGAHKFPDQPRLRFKADDVKQGFRDLPLRDWGCYELMRKHDPDYYKEAMLGALHLSEASSLLIGNMNHQLTSWLVISVLNGLRDGQRTLFDVQE